jgi:hypothetical protein
MPRYRYLDAVVDKLFDLIQGSSSQQLLRIGGLAHVACVQVVEQLLSCSHPETVLRLYRIRISQF